jgi:prepilin-type processing-associated H-X9-DG protein
MRFRFRERSAAVPGLRRRAERQRAGLNLIELVMISTILGLTLIILLPAIQHARETARRMQCYNHLWDLTLACSAHQDALRCFPTGGWPGPDYWMGDPDLWSDKRQPGGWTYNILPFLENRVLHDKGLQKSAAEKKAIFSTVAQTPLEVFYCPSRRAPTVYPIASSTVWNPRNMNPVSTAARTDYAANGRMQNGMGVIFARSLTTIKDIRDGLSHTLLLGEKNLVPDHYQDGMSLGDGVPVYGNSFWDWERSGNAPPARDKYGVDNYTAFGSVHAGGLNISFCDGSASTISYNVDPVMFERLCDRRDGKPATLP